MKRQLTFLTLALATLCVVNAANENPGDGSLDKDLAEKKASTLTEQRALLDKEHRDKVMEGLNTHATGLWNNLWDAGPTLLTQEAAKFCHKGLKHGYNYVMHDENKKRAADYFNLGSGYAANLWGNIRGKVPGAVLGFAGLLVVDSVTTEFVVESAPWAFGISTLLCYASTLLPKPSKGCGIAIADGPGEKARLLEELAKREKLLRILQCMQNMQAGTNEGDDSDSEDGDDNGKKLAEAMLDAAERQTQGATFGEKIAVDKPNSNAPKDGKDAEKHELTHTVQQNTGNELIDNAKKEEKPKKEESASTVKKSGSKDNLKEEEEEEEEDKEKKEEPKKEEPKKDEPKKEEKK